MDAKNKEANQEVQSSTDVIDDFNKIICDGNASEIPYGPKGHSSNNINQLESTEQWHHLPKPENDRTLDNDENPITYSKITSSYHTSVSHVVSDDYELPNHNDSPKSSLKRSTDMEDVNKINYCKKKPRLDTFFDNDGDPIVGDFDEKTLFKKEVGFTDVDLSHESEEEEDSSSDYNEKHITDSSINSSYDTNKSHGISDIPVEISSIDHEVPNRNNSPESSFKRNTGTEDVKEVNHCEKKTRLGNFFADLIVSDFDEKNLSRKKDGFSDVESLSHESEEKTNTGIEIDEVDDFYYSSDNSESQITDSSTSSYHTCESHDASFKPVGSSSLNHKVPNHNNSLKRSLKRNAYMEHVVSKTNHCQKKQKFFFDVNCDPIVRHSDEKSLSDVESYISAEENSLDEIYEEEYYYSADNNKNQIGNFQANPRSHIFFDCNGDPIDRDSYKKSLLHKRDGLSKVESSHESEEESDTDEEENNPSSEDKSQITLCRKKTSFYFDNGDLIDRDSHEKSLLNKRNGLSKVEPSHNSEEITHCRKNPRLHIFFDDNGHPINKDSDEKSLSRKTDRLSEVESSHQSDERDKEDYLDKTGSSEVEERSSKFCEEIESAQDLNDKKEINHLQIKPKKHIFFDYNGDPIVNDSNEKSLSIKEDVLWSDAESLHEEETSPDDEIDEEEDYTDISRCPELKKFWFRRHTLFSRYDEGIWLDRESWYSVTPEQIAASTAARCKCDVIVDGFCGAGGNTIQFAMTCSKVYAIDIDPEKIKLAKHNARVYGVRDKITFIEGSFFEEVPKLKADIVFLSPPWGGPTYLKNPVYDLETMLQPRPYSEILDTARKCSDRIAAFLPRNTNERQLIDRSLDPNLYIIEHKTKKRRIAITAFYNIEF